MRKYTVSQIEKLGVQATGTFYGTPREGWIMNGSDFVDYCVYAQLVIPVSVGSNVTHTQWYDPDIHHAAPTTPSS